ncbi:MBL fold metallo-hydrolase [Candidatus Sumerlaeota bacterium]|nr:MBL fold metallo-hydrolase [Candidatus Sumerlaeota bacterium]
MSNVTEIAPDLYRISIHVPAFNLQFNSFIVRDEEPLLFHTGMRGMFAAMREGVSKVIDPAQLRWIGFSHFEVDECGALNEWLAIAPSAQAVCSAVGAMVNISDFADRPPRGLVRDEVLSTGRHRFRFIPTPHLPHGWDAGVMFEEENRALLCSDLFHQVGDVEPVTESDVMERVRGSLLEYQAGPLMDYMPFTPHTERMLRDLATLRPRTLAAMHGSAFRGDGSQALIDLGQVMREVLGEPRD